MTPPRPSRARLLLGVAAAVGVGVGSVGEAGAQGPAPVWAQLAGAWRGEGELLGRPARFTMRWTVDGPLAVLRFGNAFAGAQGDVPVLTAAAVYRTDGASDGVWMDSRPLRLELDTEPGEGVLVVRWTAPGERGRTTYRITSPHRMEVLDEVETPEGWRVFGRASYTRVVAEDPRGREG